MVDISWHQTLQAFPIPAGSIYTQPMLWQMLPAESLNSKLIHREVKIINKAKLQNQKKKKMFNQFKLLLPLGL